MTASDGQKYRDAVFKQERERLLEGDPVPYRITVALDMRELYGPEVDRALGGEEPMVDQWESGELVPTREQIEALAALTRYPVHYFYWPVTESGGWGYVCQRSGKGKGCTRTWFGPPPPAEAPAEVIDLNGQRRLW